MSSAISLGSGSAIVAAFSFSSVSPCLCGDYVSQRPLPFPAFGNARNVMLAAGRCTGPAPAGLQGSFESQLPPVQIHVSAQEVLARQSVAFAAITVSNVAFRRHLNLVCIVSAH